MSLREAMTYLSIRHSAPDWGFFFGDDTYTFTTNGNIEVLTVEARAKVKMLRFILSSPVK